MNKYYKLIEELLLIHPNQKKDEFLNELYKIIHIANGTCENPHEGWKEEIDDRYKDLLNNL